MFLPQDRYLASGTAHLINAWVDPVYKFDSSSFYNWEQDNLPIYDLEDRDDLLFEMAGYPTSSVDGVMLTVSDAGIDNKKVFGSLSGALEALPNTMRFPVTIEVATSGQIGKLHLEDREFVGEGAGLEIINRGFAKVMAGSGTLVGALSAAVTTTNGGPNNGSNAGSAITIFSSIDVSNTMEEASSLGVSATVWNQTTDPTTWWNNFTRTFVQVPEWTQVGAATAGRTVSMSTNFKDGTTGTFMGGAGGANHFTVSQYTDNSVLTDVQNFVGAGLLYPDGTTPVQRANFIPTATNSDARATGFVYANALENVTIKNCTGDIYIRGFCVDGADAATIGSQRTGVGFDIQNSQVVLENCTAARCKDAGVLAVNSNIILNRGFVAFRNYELSSGTATLDTKKFNNPTAGLRAQNSTITLSASTEELKGLPIDSPFSFYRNIIGIDLQNSNLITPLDTGYGTDIGGNVRTDTYGSQTVVLQAFLNNYEGIKASESFIDIGQKVSSFQNRIGLRLDNSVCKVSQITLDHNGKGGLIANSSEFNYNKSADKLPAPIYTAGPFYPVTNFQANGQHANLNSSEFYPTYVSGVGTSMDDVYTRLSFSGNHEILTRLEDGNTTQQTVPAVELNNNSYMNAVAPRLALIGANDGFGAANANYLQGGTVKGTAFRVVNSSKLELIGHQYDNTFVIGNSDFAKNQKTAAVYAGNNSSIKISGPTYIVQAGVDALAEDNSVIEFGPQTKDGIIDASGWNLGKAGNHTKVELHSTRACLVANRNSVINMFNLGDYTAFWAAKYLGDADYDTLEFNTSAFTYNGHMQFYPNPFIPYNTFGIGVQGASVYPGQQLTSTTRAFGGFPQATATLSHLSLGGMCVRAVGSSQVNVQNVVFPTGWPNTSGATYDLSTVGGCDRLRIWNIADNSELHASYLAVGNSTIGGPVHPQDASGLYYGPSAVWTSSITTLAAGGGGLSGAPSSTPDTSSLSVLDSFGLGVQTHGDNGYYGKTAAENIGPFRIYVSPDAKAKFLGYARTQHGPFIPGQNPGPVSSLGFSFGHGDAVLFGQGIPYELFAQGYATSSDCSAANSHGPNYNNASAVYQDLGFSGYVTSLPILEQQANVASSFYYTSAMLPYDSANRIWLDESAINTFANAKNGSFASSGRKKIFNYYKATTVYPGEGFYSTGKGENSAGIRSANLFDLDRDL